MLNVLTTKKEMTIMGYDGGVTQPQGGNHIAIYKYIKSTPCTP